MNLLAAKRKSKDKYLYLLKQISCSIPNNVNFHYATYDLNTYYRFNDVTDAQNSFKTLTEGKSCNETFEEMYGNMKPNDFDEFGRIEVFYRIPELEDCAFSNYYKRSHRRFRLNLIHFDSDVYYAFKSLNYSNISAIDTNQEKASEELVNMTNSFINNILGIKEKRKLQPILKCIDKQEDYYMKLGLGMGFCFGVVVLAITLLLAQLFFLFIGKKSEEKGDCDETQEWFGRNEENAKFR
ncbi:unnamed protein product [Caenorhabditis angaria]|uniref:Uncharacterized protein n=1 Tax=Caenorhabditis angaria TaxID=860376 RepID=A0A9P1ISB4_9PELO|nr:unnamed protein product [Caenorhabditis angaria]